MSVSSVSAITLPISGLAWFTVFPPLFLCALYAGLVISLIVLIRRLKKQSRFDRNA